jgi:pimeloyl-ACP methyl ester carboxylesterase
MTGFDWALGGAAALGALVLANRRLAEEAEAAYPPLGRLLDIGGVRLHALDRGPRDGALAPIVLIHGNGSLVEDWVTSGVVGLLARDRRVVAFDRPGYGYTARPDDRDWTAEAQAALFAAGARALGVGRPIVVGHSFGVLPALAWALARPHEASALVLLSGYYFPSPRLDVATQRLIDLPGVGATAANSLLPVQGRLTGPAGNRLIFAPRKPTRGYREGMPFPLMLRPRQLRAVIADGAQLVHTARRLAPRYRDLAVPLTIVWGTGDRLVRQKDQSARLVGELPHARALALGGLGHMLHHNAPRQVAQAIAEADRRRPQ